MTTPSTSGPLRTVLFMGMTGSGKGTQTELFAEKTGFEIFSTGAKFRELRECQDQLGERIRSEYDQGLLMPPWFATLLFEEKLVFEPFEKGVVFEGACRTLFETRAFHAVATWLRRPYVAVFLNINEEESMRRQMARFKVENRPDSDSRVKIETRFEEYRTLTMPGIEFMRNEGLVIDIDGMRSVEEIHEDILKQIQPLL